jgi:leucyl aminopeptidase
LRSAPMQRWLSSVATSTATTSTTSATSSATTSTQRGPDVDQLPIDNELKDRLRNTLNDLNNNMDQGSSGGGPPANRGPFGSPPPNANQ